MQFFNLTSLDLQSIVYHYVFCLQQPIIFCLAPTPAQNQSTVLLTSFPPSLSIFHTQWALIPWHLSIPFFPPHLLFFAHDTFTTWLPLITHCELQMYTWHCISLSLSFFSEGFWTVILWADLFLLWPQTSLLYPSFLLMLTEDLTPYSTE